MNFKNVINKSALLTFKRWSRKSFGVFRSLKQVVKIGVLTAIFSIIAKPQKGYAQTDTTSFDKHYNLDEVVVSSSGAQKAFTHMPRMVTIVPGQVILKLPAQSLNELLKIQPGVDIRQRGQQGVQADVSIRGGSFDQTLILVNGIPVNNPQTGHHNLNLPFSTESVQRIEILNGPGTKVYGPNAFTGAVNFITPQYANNKILVGLSGGMHGLLNMFATASFVAKKITHFLSVGHNQCNGYKTNTDFKSNSVFYSASLIEKPGHFMVQVGYVNKAFGAHDFYSLAYPEQFEQVSQFLTSGSYFKKAGNVTYNAKVYYLHSTDRFELFREDIYKYSDGYYIASNFDTAKYVAGNYDKSNYYSGHNYHLTKTAGINTNVLYNSLLGNTYIGIDYRYESVLSNVLGEVADTVKVFNSNKGFYTKSAWRKHVNIFFEHYYSYKKIDITAGVLAHYNNNYGARFNGGLEAAVNIYKNSKVFVSVNQAMRLPTYTDLYYQSHKNTGNPNLKPEEAVTAELGAKFYKPAFTGQVSVYGRQIHNAIDWVKYPSQTKYTTINFTKLNAYGTDIYAQLQPSQIFAPIGFVNYIALSYGFTNVYKVQQDSSLSAYALDYLKNKLSVQTNIKIYKKLSVTLSLLYNHRNGTFTSQTASEVGYLPYWLFDAGVYFKHKNYKVFCDINNILNKKYVDIGGIEQAGLWAKAGLVIGFDLNKPETNLK